MARFEEQADPDGTLPPAERAQRAEHLRKAHFQRLALLSAQSRRIAKEASEKATTAEAEIAAAGDAS